MLRHFAADDCLHDDLVACSFVAFAMRVGFAPLVFAILTAVRRILECPLQGITIFLAYEERRYRSCGAHAARIVLEHRGLRRQVIVPINYQSEEAAELLDVEDLRDDAAATVVYHDNWLVAIEGRFL